MASHGVVVIGAYGRMGQRISALLAESDLAIAARVGREGPALDADLGAKTSCVIDFSTLGQLPDTVRFCVEHKVPLVLGTTGLDASHESLLDEAAKSIPVLWAPNFSVGVHVLLDLVSQAARLLDEGWDAELIEAHHHNKVDAPSGTALAIAQRVVAARSTSLSEVACYGREGQVGKRPKGEVGIHAVRGGSIVGEHTLSFFGAGEVLTLEHRALDRDIFARGAVRAALWMSSAPRKPQRYGIADILRRD